MLKNKKNIIAISLTMFLVLAGVAFLFPVQKALAATTITTCEELQNMKNNLAEDYSLGNDIDCDVAPYNSGAGFEPIGDSYANSFTGTFDGQTYKITDLYINRPATNYVGLFGNIGNATIENAYLEDVNITGSNYVGGLGGNIYSSSIDNCWSSGTITGNYRIGGLTGYLSSSPINNSYSTCDVSGTSYTGGLAGYAIYSASIMTNCYFAGTVTASGSYVGAVAGYWKTSAAANNCFYDNEITDKTDSLATGKTTAEMKQQATFTNWDFVDIWKINEGVTYPSFITPVEYISSVKNFTAPVNFNTLSWSETIESGVTSISMYTRAGNVPVPDSSWTDWLAVSNSGDAIPDDCDNKQYLQYKAVLVSSDPYKTPYLHDVTVSYYYSSDALTSSKYNSEEAANVIAGVKWTEDATLPSGTEVAISVRSASSSANLDSAGWSEVAVSTPSSLTTGCTKAEGSQEVICNDSENSVIPESMRDGAGDQWMQYKIGLTSTGANTPTVESFTLIYVVNTPPDFEVAPTVSQGSDGLVGISYSVRDIDTAQDGAACPNCVTPSFEYSLENGDTGTWYDITLGLSEGATFTKAVEEVAYTTHSLTWDPKTMVDDNYSAIAKIRVTVNDGEAANMEASSASSAFTIDTTDPVPVLTVDSKDDAANVLSLSVTEDTMEDLTMKLSNNNLLSADGQNADSGNWINYATTKDWILNGDPETIYYQLKDKYGNVSADDSISSVAIPRYPSSIVYQDISNPETSEWREFIAWGEVEVPSLGFKRYNIYRSINEGGYSLLTTETDREINYIVDSNLNTANIYSYKVTAEDNSDNISNYSSVISDQPDGQGGTDLTSPTITSVSPSNTTTQSATITWDTNELSNSTVEYIIVTGGDFTSAPSQGVATMLDNASGLGQHSVTLTGLIPNTTYYYQVKSADPSGNSATSKQGDDGYTFSTLDGPSISNVSASDIGNIQAIITWSTDASANSYVVYSVNADLSSSTEVGSATETTDHSVTITGLTTGTQYYYYVKSGIATDNNGGEYYTFTTTVDSTAPIITFDSNEDITNITDTSARISWTTNEMATSTIAYGITTDYGNILSNNNYNTNHSFNLSGLTSGTLYYFELASADSDGNIQTDNNENVGFTTTDSTDSTAPNITTNPSASTIGDIYAVITWITDEASDSQVDYGLATNTYTLSETNSSMDTSHSIKLTDLTADTKYYYQVISADINSNATTSAEYTFTTLETLSEESDVQAREDAATPDCPTCGGGGGILIIDKTDKVAPTISNIKVSDVGSESVKISWITDEKANSFVEYGLNNSYGNVLGNYNFITEHFINLKFLNPSKKYYYRVASQDTWANHSISENQTFTTLSLSQKLEQEATEELSLEDLESSSPGKTEDKQSSENLFEIASSAIIKAMSIIEQAASQVSISSLQSTLTSQKESIEKLSKSIPAPLMSGEPKVETTATTATVIWQTDKESNSLVAIVPENLYNEKNANPYQQVIGSFDETTTNHSVTIYDLEPDTIYHYQLRSQAFVGPMAQSKDFTFKTKKETLEISNYRVQNVSDQTAIFKWATNIEADSTIKYIPYRNNILAVDEIKTEKDKPITTIHEIEINGFEAGIIYEVELISKDINDNIANEKLSAFSTAKDDLPPIIRQVQTDSALSPGTNAKVQTIISWFTNEQATTRIYYQKGIVQSKENKKLSEKTKLDTNYTKKHVVVLTKFNPGSVYSFKVESIDSGGNVSLSKIYTILTPRQKESVFQVIMKNMEDIFGWMGKMKR